MSRESGGDGDAGDAGDADGGNGGNGDGGNTPDQANQADGTSLHAPDIYLASHFMGVLPQKFGDNPDVRPLKSGFGGKYGWDLSNHNLVWLSLGHLVRHGTTWYFRIFQKMIQQINIAD